MPYVFWLSLYIIDCFDFPPAAVMEDEEELFDEPAVDHASLVFTHHEKSVFTVALDPSGAVAASGGEDDMAFVWKVTDGKVMFQCDGHKVRVLCWLNLLSLS
jgi:WD40 repeat protein